MAQRAAAWPGGQPPLCSLHVCHPRQHSGAQVTVCVSTPVSPVSTSARSLYIWVPRIPVWPGSHVSTCRCAEIRPLRGPCTYPPSHVRVRGLQWHRRFSEGPAVAGTALPACGDDFCPPARYFYPPPLSVCNGQVQAGVRLRASVWRPRSLAEGRCDGVPSPEQPPAPQAVGRSTRGEPAHPDPPA